MGTKLSKKYHEEKETMKRFILDFEKVNNYIKEAKESEEDMDFEEAATLYMHALKVIYAFMDETQVPDDISREISTVVVDMIKKREDLKEYKKMHDIALKSYKEDNQRFKEEDGRRSEDTEESEDEQEDIRSTVNDMAAAYHCTKELQKRIDNKKLNSKERFELECQILNKRAEGEEQESSNEEEEEESETDRDEPDEASELDEQEGDDNVVEYKEEVVHFTDIEDVKLAMNNLESRLTISRDKFKTDYEYIITLTKKILEDSNSKGIRQDLTVDQLAPLVNRIVWERNMQDKMNQEDRKYTQQEVQKLVKDLAAGYEKKIKILQKEQNSKPNKDNDTQKELKEIYDALYAKLEKPGRAMKDFVTFDSIIGLHSVKRALDTGIQVPLQRPELVASGDIKHYEGLLLFGPPGTGKSMIAKALANEAKNCAFIQVDRADLVSKWQGQSEKIVNTLFKIARQNKPCIVFVDEIEGLLEDRDGGEGSSNGGKVVTVLLTAMQNLGRDQVFVLGASNYPWKLDKAFYRRFSQIIYVRLPNFGERVEIFQSNIYHNESTTKKDITKKDIEHLALLTEQYSGSHITKVVETALAIRYQRVSKVKYFKRSIKGKGYWQPCTKEEEGARKMSIKQVPKILMPPLLMDDLEMALFEIKNNIEKGYLRKLVKWGEKNSNMTE